MTDRSEMAMKIRHPKGIESKASRRDPHPFSVAFFVGGDGAHASTAFDRCSGACGKWMGCREVNLQTNRHKAVDQEMAGNS